jgi:hypothetical protein
LCGSVCVLCVCVFIYVGLQHFCEGSRSREKSLREKSMNKHMHAGKHTRTYGDSSGYTVQPKHRLSAHKFRKHKETQERARQNDAREREEREREKEREIERDIESRRGSTYLNGGDQAGEGSSIIAVGVLVAQISHGELQHGAKLCL